ncbi:hypothetical protein EBBID32_950 [Sphingobium indicum BiD32]|uniref:Uncharacterized protein n=1 Tax=Sphingobium indicum BiD32 TaxID=1301087 RepID=N1MJE5_9SPHN|nr:hypothetical protein EBBID32_950 [Sphingobium indicum BiD32]
MERTKANQLAPAPFAQGRMTRHDIGQVVPVARVTDGALECIGLCGRSLAA